MKPLARFLAAFCVALPTLPSAAALAAEPEVPALPAVQVEAARVRGVDPFDLPASFSTVDAAAAADRRGAQASELLDGLPGVVARDRQNYAQDTQLSIRGFGARSTFGVRGVRLYVDGVPATMPDGQGQLSHFNVIGAERVEVLRGPFSALYGNASGGVVQWWSGIGAAADPWRVRATWGSDDTFTAGAQLRGARGPFDYNVAASHFETAGWREHSRARRESLNARLGWSLGEGRDLTLVMNYLDAPDAQDPLGLTRAQFEADPRQATAVATQFNTRKSVRQPQAGLVYQQLAGAGSLRLMAYAGERTVEQFLAVPVAVQANPLHAGGVVDLDGGYGGADARWSWQGELAGRPFDFTVGASADRQRQHRTGYENFVGDVLGVKGALRRDQEDRVSSLDQFAQAWWQWSPRWSGLVGVRHSEVNFRSDDDYITARNPDDSGRTDYSATTPVAGIVFRASDATQLYASLGRGFETPTFNELGYRADGGAGLALDLRPATSRNYELGAKWQGREQAAATLAVFRADTEDELAVASNTNGRSTYRNIGRTRRAGVEAGWTQPLAARAQLELAYTWLQATVREGYLVCASSGCAVPNTWVAPGTRLPGVPRQQFSARWVWRPAPWQLAVEMEAADSTGVNDLGSEASPGYGLLALAASREWRAAQGTLRAFARIDNVFDRAYVGSVIVNDGNGRYYEPGPGRSFLVGMEWNFRP
jgi:iron complex outermembrane receptor protein